MKLVKDTISMIVMTDVPVPTGSTAKPSPESQVAAGSTTPLYVNYPTAPVADTKSTIVKLMFSSAETDKNRKFSCNITVYRQFVGNDFHVPSARFNDLKVDPMYFIINSVTKANECELIISDLFNFRDRYATTSQFLVECKVYDTNNKYDTATYCAVIKSATCVSSPLPITSIYTTDRDTVPMKPETAKMFIDVLKAAPDLKGTTSYKLDGLDDSATSNITRASGTVKISGNWSAGFAKKNYSVKLDSKESVFGISKSSSWTFKANFLERTQIVNKLVFDLFREMGHSSPKAEHSLLYLNNNFQGLYTVVQDKSDSLASKLSTTLPYVFMADRSAAEPTESFTSSLGRQIVVESPKNPNLGPLKAFIDVYENDLKSGGNWQQHVHVESEIDMMILTDVFFNIDSYIDAHNTLYFINADNKIETSVWDLDMAFYTDREPAFKPNNPYLLWGAGMRYNFNNPDFHNNQLTKFQMKDIKHVSDFKDRFYSLYATILEPKNLANRIRTMAESLDLAYKLDYGRWSEKMNPNATADMLVKNLTDRLNFMNNDVKNVKLWKYEPRDGKGGKFSYPDPQIVPY